MRRSCIGAIPPIPFFPTHSHAWVFVFFLTGGDSANARAALPARWGHPATRSLSVAAGTVPSMPEDDLLPALEWFSQHLTLREQVPLLRDPRQSITNAMAVKLSHRFLVYAADSDPERWQLAPSLIGQLTDIRDRLDVWWEGLGPDDRAYIIESREGELDGEYAVHIHDAGLASSVERALAGIVSDGKTKRFPLPQMIRVYVEMKAAE